jgi:hypothetical protein
MTMPHLVPECFQVVHVLAPRSVLSVPRKVQLVQQTDAIDIDTTLFTVLKKSELFSLCCFVMVECRGPKGEFKYCTGMVTFRRD